MVKYAIRESDASIRKKKPATHNLVVIIDFFDILFFRLNQKLKYTNTDSLLRHKKLHTKAAAARNIFIAVFLFMVL